MQGYALMYSLYSWPNVILSFFGGLLIDRVFGIRVGTIVFSVLICVGQVCVCVCVCVGPGVVV